MPDEKSTTPLTPTRKINLKRLGTPTGEWKDIIKNAGNQADEVKRLVYELMLKKQLPDVTVELVSDRSTPSRTYVVVTTFPDPFTTVVISAEKYGTELLAARRIYPKVVFAGWVLITLAVWVVISLPLSGGALNCFPLQLAGNLLFGIIVIAVAGQLVKGKSSAFFYKTPSEDQQYRINAMNEIIDETLLEALGKVGVSRELLRTLPTQKPQ